MPLGHHSSPHLPTKLDLGAITEALSTAGFTLRDAQISAIIRTWYRVPTGDHMMDQIEVHVPSPQFGISDDPNSASHLLAVKVLTTLIDLTGDPHLWCGPRDARERAYVDMVNGLTSAA